MAACILQRFSNGRFIFLTIFQARAVLTCYSWRHNQVIEGSTAPLSTYKPLHAGRKYREEKGRGPRGTEYGPLTDLPDWSYADGRPAPLSKGQMRRKDNERKIAMKIDELASEIKLTKSLQSEVFQEELKEMEKRSEIQLKPKGRIAEDL